MDFPPDGPIQWWNARQVWELATLIYQTGISIYRGKRSSINNEAHYAGRYDDGRRTNSYWNASEVRTGTSQTVSSIDCIYLIEVDLDDARFFWKLQA